MSDEKKYYEILGISDDESKLQGNEFEKILKKKYRDACKKWHPDKWATGTEDEKAKADENFKKISEAYGVLSDPKKRFVYDNGSYSEQNDMWGAYANGEDDFEIFGGFGRRKKKGKDRVVYVNATINELLQNAKKKIRYSRNRQCSCCGGKGYVSEQDVSVCGVCGGTGKRTETFSNGYMSRHVISTCTACGGVGKRIIKPCEKCGGGGFEQKEEEIEITLSNGLNDKVGERIPGMGDYPLNWDGYASSIGDLVFIVSVPVDKDGFYCDREYNIRKSINVGILDCITGTQYIDTYVDGTKIKIEIPAGTMNDMTFRIPNKGLVNQYGMRGDYLLTIKSIMPKKLSDREIKKINELKKEKNFKNK